MKEFDEIWELDPTKLGGGGEVGPAWSVAGQCLESAWSVVDAKMPALSLDRGEQMVSANNRATYFRQLRRLPSPLSIHPLYRPLNLLLYYHAWMGIDRQTEMMSVHI